MDHYSLCMYTYDSVCNHNVVKIDRIAQLVEQPTCYRQVVGSDPTPVTSFQLVFRAS